MTMGGKCIAVRQKGSPSSFGGHFTGTFPICLPQCFLVLGDGWHCRPLRTVPSSSASLVGRMDPAVAIRNIPDVVDDPEEEEEDDQREAGAQFSVFELENLG